MCHITGTSNLLKEFIVHQNKRRSQKLGLSSNLISIHPSIRVQ